MGRYSSDSESSRSSRHKRSKKSRRSSRGRSRSASPKRCKKKVKKYKRSNRSTSRDTRSRHSSDSRSKHRRRSRSRSTSDRRRRNSNSRDASRDRKRKDDYKKSKYSKSKKKHRSSSSGSSSSSSTSKSKSPTPKRKFDYDPDELLEKLNKAAVEAMAANKKNKTDPLSTIEMQIKRHDVINELRSGGSSSLGQSDISSIITPLPPPAPLLSSKLTDKTLLDDTPVVVDVNATGLTSNTPSQSSDFVESLLHPNFMLENQEEKLNRWVKKLFLIRQRAMSGEMISV